MCHGSKHQERVIPEETEKTTSTTCEKMAVTLLLTQEVIYQKQYLAYNTFHVAQHDMDICKRIGSVIQFLENWRMKINPSYQGVMAGSTCQSKIVY